MDVAISLQVYTTKVFLMQISISFGWCHHPLGAK